HPAARTSGTRTASSRNFLKDDSASLEGRRFQRLTRSHLSLKVHSTSNWVVTGLPSLVAGSNFHWETASMVLLSSASERLFTTLGPLICPSRITIILSLTVPSIFASRGVSSYVGHGE